MKFRGKRFLWLGFDSGIRNFSVNLENPAIFAAATILSARSASYHVLLFLTHLVHFTTSSHCFPPSGLFHSFSKDAKRNKRSFSNRTPARLCQQNDFLAQRLEKQGPFSYFTSPKAKPHSFFSTHSLVLIFKRKRLCEKSIQLPFTAPAGLRDCSRPPTLLSQACTESGLYPRNSTCQKNRSGRKNY